MLSGSIAHEPHYDKPFISERTTFAPPGEVSTAQRAPRLHTDSSDDQKIAVASSRKNDFQTFFFFHSDFPKSLFAVSPVGPRCWRKSDSPMRKKCGNTSLATPPTSTAFATLSRDAANSREWRGAPLQCCVHVEGHRGSIPEGEKKKPSTHPPHSTH